MAVVLRRPDTLRVTYLTVALMFAGENSFVQHGTLLVQIGPGLLTEGERAHQFQRGSQPPVRTHKVTLVNHIKVLYLVAVGLIQCLHVHEQVVAVQDTMQAFPVS